MAGSIHLDNPKWAGVAYLHSLLNSPKAQPHPAYKGVAMNDPGPHHEQRRPISSSIAGMNPSIGSGSAPPPIPKDNHPDENTQAAKGKGWSG